jgi:glycosyltransferase involved in cell wall biosynthesis
MSPDPTSVVSIIMPVRNERRHIGAALDAALAQDIDAPIEVIVADGMSADGTRDVVAQRARADARVRLVDNPSGRTPSGLNAALAAAKGRYVVRLDGHTIAPPDYARRLVAHLVDGDCEAAGGIKHAVGTGAFGQAVAAAHGSRFGIGNSRHHYAGRPGPVDHIPHGAYDIAIARAIGGFAEDLVRNQDYDFDRRFAAMGGRIRFDPSISLDWHVRETPRALASQYAQYGYWKYVVLRRHPSSLHARWLAPPALVATLVASAALSPWRPARLVLGGTCGAYGGVLALGATVVGRRSGRNRPRIGLALATMHLSWGAGFLAGALTVRRGRQRAPRQARTAGTVRNRMRMSSESDQCRAYR